MVSFKLPTTLCFRLLPGRVSPPFHSTPPLLPPPPQEILPLTDGFRNVPPKLPFSSNRPTINQSFRPLSSRTKPWNQGERSPNNLFVSSAAQPPGKKPPTPLLPDENIRPPPAGFRLFPKWANPWTKTARPVFPAAHGPPVKFFPFCRFSCWALWPP